MNLTINQIPKKWKPYNGKSFSNWFKHHIKSAIELDEDYQLLKNK